MRFYFEREKNFNIGTGFDNVVIDWYNIIGLCGQHYSNYGFSVMINGETIDSRSSSGSLYWGETVISEEGTNPFEITVTNTAGKTYTETRTIEYVVSE